MRTLFKRYKLSLLVLPAALITLSTFVGLFQSSAAAESDSTPVPFFESLQTNLLHLGERRSLELEQESDKSGNAVDLFPSPSATQHNPTATEIVNMVNHSATSTSTPQATATHTRQPTESPEATDTPTPTKTPHPSNTPEPTEADEGSPTPTKTKEASKTPEPTNTAQPSNTPEPTETDEPTETPDPDDD